MGALYKCLAVGLIAPIFLLSSCSKVKVTGNGKVVTESVKLTKKFSRLSLGTITDITLVKGKKQKVTFSTDSNLIKHFNWVVDGDTLELNKHNIDSWHTDKGLKVIIETPRLASINLYNQAQLTAKAFSEKALAIQLHDQAQLKWKGDIAVLSLLDKDQSIAHVVGNSSSLSIDLEDQALATVQGAIATVAAHLQDQAKLNGLALVAGQANIEMTDQSQATLTVNGPLSYLLSDTSQLNYTGKATIKSAQVRDQGRVARI